MMNVQNDKAVKRKSNSFNEANKKFGYNRFYPGRVRVPGVVGTLSLAICYGEFCRRQRRGKN
jgi:hypothetical protein